MDTTAEYIKMCEKAGEIQKLWKTQEGDFCHEKRIICDIETNKIVGEQTYIHCVDERFNYHHFTWLPRQDQLFEMVDWKCNISKTDLKYSWAVWHGKAGYGSFNDADSCEQALLEMIMKEKYNKTWDGEEWATTPKQ